MLTPQIFVCFRIKFFKHVSNLLSKQIQKHASLISYDIVIKPLVLQVKFRNYTFRYVDNISFLPLYYYHKSKSLRSLIAETHQNTADRNHKELNPLSGLSYQKDSFISFPHPISNASPMHELIQNRKIFKPDVNYSSKDGSLQLFNFFRNRRK